MKGITRVQWINLFWNNIQVQVQVQISFIGILHYIEHCQNYYKFNKISYLNYYNSNKYLLKCEINLLILISLISVN